MKHQLVFAAMAMMGASATAMAEAQWQHAGGVGMHQFVVVDQAASTDEAVLRSAVRSVCASEPACVVTFWSDAASVPTQMPMNHAQQHAAVARYVHTASLGNEELLFRCQANSPKGAKCLR